ncbi:ABC transporter substrate-binding protein [Nocardioides sp. zg-536]|uniref:ABC transporter substrate-binding protein n=1 Tax=Nocardioides faecalis TaxID=2803858 RepID=A0A939BUJ7_9ACTN|nr:ABC transporter substrate-binding protein [Nocardioides faecalis]MBM9461739.1 ABC transporter substrate-binding protein [Nocardioides faecalis]MBS4752484.1 ABC transporter substrate-binding protein [Nocardioides faecalis]QVI57761.1 ABC transporter substrate-binding protein [Nocardioides faecalis]
MTRFRTGVALAAAATLTVALAACGGGDSDPLSSGDKGGETIVIGSQDYYSSEILAEAYAQALEAEGYDVDRQFKIGQREAYLPEIESGSIDLFPEYTGPLLLVWEPDTTVTLSDDVYDALVEATPDGLRVLDQSPATDQDAYVVTREFAEKWDLTSIEDLKKVTEPLVFGANSESETRPNGPKGLKRVYDVEVGFTPIEDGGGPLTVKALKDGDIQLAFIYTGDPSLKKNDLVALEDTKGLFVASHVVPVASDDVDDDAAGVINRISAAMSPEDLVNLNARSVDEQLPAATIAKEWLKEEGLL